MKIHKLLSNELAELGVTLIEGQCNNYNRKNKMHTRSYICGYMDKCTFARIRPMLHKYRICYLLQSINETYIEEAIRRTVWLTKHDSKGYMFLSETNEILHLNDDQVYFVMWKRFFPPRSFFQLDETNVDNILLHLLKGEKVPSSWLKNLFLYVTAVINV